MARIVLTVSGEMTWNPAYLTGDARLDEQHRHLMDEADRVLLLLSRGEREGALAATAALREGFVEHGAFEEAIMERTGYPLAATHRAAHASLIRQAKWVEAELRAGIPLEAVIASAQAMLRGYLTKHVAETDKALVRWLAQREQLGRTG